MLIATSVQEWRGVMMSIEDAWVKTKVFFIPTIIFKFIYASVEVIGSIANCWLICLFYMGAARQENSNVARSLLSTFYSLAQLNSVA